MNAIAHRVVIGYGSESGNARALAQQLAADPALQPFSPQVLTLNEISPGMLQDGNPLFIISSQFGDGEPPSNAEAFLAGERELLDQRLDAAGARPGTQALAQTTGQLVDARARAVES